MARACAVAGAGDGRVSHRLHRLARDGAGRALARPTCGCTGGAGERELVRDLGHAARCCDPGRLAGRCPWAAHPSGGRTAGPGRGAAAGRRRAGCPAGSAAAPAGRGAGGGWDVACNRHACGTRTVGHALHLSRSCPAGRWRSRASDPDLRAAGHDAGPARAPGRTRRHHNGRGWRRHRRRLVGGDG